MHDLREPFDKDGRSSAAEGSPAAEFAELPLSSVLGPFPASGLADEVSKGMVGGAPVEVRLCDMMFSAKKVNHRCD